MLSDGMYDLHYFLHSFIAWENLSYDYVLLRLQREDSKSGRGNPVQVQVSPPAPLIAPNR